MSPHSKNWPYFLVSNSHWIWWKTIYWSKKTDTRLKLLILLRSLHTILSVQISSPVCKRVKDWFRDKNIEKNKNFESRHILNSFYMSKNPFYRVVAATIHLLRIFYVTKITLSDKLTWKVRTTPTFRQHLCWPASLHAGKGELKQEGETNDEFLISVLETEFTAVLVR